VVAGFLVVPALLIPGAASTLTLDKIELSTEEGRTAGTDAEWSFKVEAVGTGLVRAQFRRLGDLEWDPIDPVEGAEGEFEGEFGPFPTRDALEAEFPPGTYEFLLNQGEGDEVGGSLDFGIALDDGVVVTSPEDGAVISGQPPQTFSVATACSNCDELNFEIEGLTSQGADFVVELEGLSTNSAALEEFGIDEIPHGEYEFTAELKSRLESQEAFDGVEFEYGQEAARSDEVTFTVPEPAELLAHAAALALAGGLGTRRRRP
jgi:hypothetical protein